MNALTKMSRRRLLQVAALVVLVSGSILVAVTNVSTAPTADDIAQFERVLGLRANMRPDTFDGEVALIRSIQAKVFRLAPRGKGIPERRTREPRDLFQHGSGLCFDRSRTLDKALKFVGFETRHVFVLYKQNRSFWQALTRTHHPSHAITEAKTSRGWMFVDSNSLWIGLTDKGEAIDADTVWQRLDDLPSAPTPLREPWWAIRGMYSRSGRLYPPYIPFPDFNWADFIGWLIG